MKKVNTITIAGENYVGEFEWKKAIQDTIFLLLKNRYIMTVREEEYGIVVIDYEHEWSTGLGEYAPIWLTLSEEERLVYDEDEDKVDEEE